MKWIIVVLHRWCPIFIPLSSFIQLFHLSSQRDHFPFLCGLKLFISMYLTLFVHNKCMRATISCKKLHLKFILYCVVPRQLLSESQVPHVNFSAGITVNKQGNYTMRHKGCHIVLWVAKLWCANVWVRQDCCIPELLGYHFDISQKCWFIGFFTKMPKATISFVMSICMEQYGSC